MNVTGAFDNILHERLLYILKSLQTIQRRANRIITGAFKVTSLPALDIETFLLPISLKLDILASESLLQIASGQLYETILLTIAQNQPNPNNFPL